MKKKIFSISGIILIILSLIILIVSFLDKRFYAFDGAEGFGAYADGGRYGRAYHVTSLEDSSNKGTLRYALEQKGARLIVFDISGVIELKSPLIINNSSVTIAGQTAPGDGICIKNNGLVINANNVIIRYIRIRPGKTTQNIPALLIDNSKNIILDHCTISWATGGNIILDNVKDITIQWSFINETLGDFAIDFKGTNQNVSIHHNLFANNHNSNINFGMGYTNKYIDIRNNLFFNWDENTITNPGLGEYNIVNNYYKFGPNTFHNNRNQLVSTLHSPKNIKMLYVMGNDVYINPILSRNNIAGIYPNDEFMKTSKNNYLTKKEYFHSAVSTHSGENSKTKILDLAGTSLMRDYIDTKVANDSESSSFKNVNLFNNNIGIYPEYKTDYTYIDADEDGIRDDWEIANNLNPYNKMDVYDQNSKKRAYTNRDVYLDSIVKNITKKQFEYTMFNVDNLKIKLFKLISNIK